jgi:predicted transcriptional regulator
MQVLQHTFKIEETERKDILLEVISDKYCRSILESTMYKPKSVMEISAESKIPISTVYRRIQILHDNKLLVTSGTISSDGKKLFLYKSKIKGIQSNFNEGQVEVKIVLNK